MRAALLALVIPASFVGLFVACSDTSGADPLIPEDGGGGDATEDAQGEEDAGHEGPVSPDGCRLVTTDYRSGSKAENLPRPDVPGAVDWVDVEDALNEDGKFASVTLDDGQESAELRVSGFGLDLAESVETWGIEVQLKRRAPDGGVEDAKLTLAIDGLTDDQIDWKYVKGPWPSRIVGTHHYGQALDTWKVDLYPHHVNSDTFAARLSVRKQGDAGPGPVTALVESMKVAIWYCPK